MSTARLLSRAARVQYRVLERLRHPEAFDAARAPGTAPDFEALAGHHYCLLVSFRRTGEAVPTPVLFGLAEGRLCFRSEWNVGKIKRIRHDPHVRVGPCDARGRPLGPLTEARARVLPATEELVAYDALQANYTPAWQVVEGALDRSPLRLAYVEVVPAPGEAA